MVEVLLFDLDGTLYPNSNPYLQHVVENVWEFMHVKLGIPRSTPAEHIWRPLFQQYHQSERAFRAQGWQFDRDEYWRFIRAGTERFLMPDAELAALLSSLPQPKYVFTNAKEEQANEALRCLGVEGHFQGVFGADLFMDQCKPDKEAYDKVLTAIGGPDPSKVAFFEDSYKNLLTAKDYGMKTILIESHSELIGEGRTRQDYHQVVDSVISKMTLDEVRSAAPYLWPDFIPPSP